MVSIIPIVSSFIILCKLIGIFLYDLKMEIFLASVATFPYKFFKILLKVFEFNVYPKFANKAVVQLFTANFIS
jgi:hypothetical protein